MEKLKAKKVSSWSSGKSMLLVNIDQSTRLRASQDVMAQLTGLKCWLIPTLFATMTTVIKLRLTYSSLRMKESTNFWEVLLPVSMNLREIKNLLRLEEWKSMSQALKWEEVLASWSTSLVDVRSISMSPSTSPNQTRRLTYHNLFIIWETNRKTSICKQLER